MFLETIGLFIIGAQHVPKSLYNPYKNEMAGSE